MGIIKVTSGPQEGLSVAVEGEMVIGREDADLTILDSEVSRRHAALRPTENGVVVEDLGSTNGTFVDGHRISEPVTLTSSSSLRVGKSELSLELSPTAPPDAPLVDVDQATRARDVPVAPVDDATRARDIPVADVDDATRARDIPVADVDDATRARDIPVAGLDDSTRARDVPVADVDDATRARDMPVADVGQPTVAHSTSPPPGEQPPSGHSPLGTTFAGIPALAFALLGVIFLLVIVLVLLG